MVSHARDPGNAVFPVADVVLPQKLEENLLDASAGPSAGPSGTTCNRIESCGMTSASKERDKRDEGEIREMSSVSDEGEIREMSSVSEEGEIVGMSSVSDDGDIREMSSVTEEGEIIGTSSGGLEITSSEQEDDVEGLCEDASYPDMLLISSERDDSAQETGTSSGSDSETSLPEQKDDVEACELCRDASYAELLLTWNYHDDGAKHNSCLRARFNAEFRKDKQLSDECKSKETMKTVLQTNACSTLSAGQEAVEDGSSEQGGPSNVHQLSAEIRGCDNDASERSFPTEKGPPEDVLKQQKQKTQTKQDLGHRKSVEQRDVSEIQRLNSTAGSPVGNG